MSSIIPGYKNPTANKTSKRKTLLYVVGLAAVAICLLVGIYYFALNSVTGGKKDLKQVSAELNALDKEPDCHKSLKKLETLGIDTISGADGKKTEAVEKVIYYRIHCNNTLEDYDGALEAANDLKDYYEETNASPNKKTQAEDMISSIEESQEMQRKDQSTDRDQPVKNDGPLL